MLASKVCNQLIINHRVDEDDENMLTHKNMLADDIKQNMRTARAPPGTRTDKNTLGLARARAGTRASRYARDQGHARGGTRALSKR